MADRRPSNRPAGHRAPIQEVHETEADVMVGFADACTCVLRGATACASFVALRKRSSLRWNSPEKTTSGRTRFLEKCYNQAPLRGASSGTSVRGTTKDRQLGARRCAPAWPPHLLPRNQAVGTVRSPSSVRGHAGGEATRSKENGRAGTRISLGNLISRAARSRR